MSIRLYLDTKIGWIIMIHSTLVSELKSNTQSQGPEKKLYIVNITKANIDEKEQTTG